MQLIDPVNNHRHKIKKTGKFTCTFDFMEGAVAVTLYELSKKPFARTFATEPLCIRFHDMKMYIVYGIVGVYKVHFSRNLLVFVVFKKKSCFDECTVLNHQSPSRAIRRTSDFVMSMGSVGADIASNTIEL